MKSWNQFFAASMEEKKLLAQQLVLLQSYGPFATIPFALPPSLQSQLKVQHQKAKQAENHQKLMKWLKLLMSCGHSEEEAKVLAPTSDLNTQLCCQRHKNHHV